MRATTSFSLIFLFGSLVLTGCAGQPASVPAEDAAAHVAQSEAPQSEDVEEGGPSQEDIRAYFEAFSSGDPKDAAEAVQLAEPGSNAAAYAIYLQSTQQALRDFGFSQEKQKVEAIDGGFSLCPEFVTEEAPCSEYTKIQHVGDRIADFDAGGEPLSGRLTLGNGVAEPLGEIGEAEMIAAYRSISGTVVVTFDITSKSDGLFVYANYLAPDGRQSESTAMNGPLDLASGAFGTYAFYFDGAEFGGTVSLEAFSDTAFDVPATKFATK